MDRVMVQRGAMVLIGALAGGSCFTLASLADRGVLAGRPALLAFAFCGVFFAGLLAMAGPLGKRRAALGAAGLGAAVAVLLVWASFRFEAVEGLFDSPLPVIAALVLALVPMPFLIAAGGPGWRDYPALFTASWGLVVRTGAAWVFVGVVWTVILLSDALLGLVGISAIGDIVGLTPVAWGLTGAVFGLGLAVVDELGEVLSPYLVLRLLRLLLPAVLLVLAVFLLALPVRGLDAIFGRFSSALLMLVIAGFAATLVTIAIDQGDGEAVRGPVMLRATQALAGLLVLPALLGGWAVWERVAQYGLTPERIFAAVVALMGIGYGALYLVALLRGRGWMARIRRANITMALVLIGVAALWLTPGLNPEALSARDQLARFEAGRTPAARLDLAALDEWGRAGAAARARLEVLAAEPGQEALARRLADLPVPSEAPGGDAEALRADLASAMPLQPGGATATRDLMLAGLAADEIALWLDACRAPLPEGGPGCVMVVADFWPERPGEEAVAILRDASGWVRYEGLALEAGVLLRPSVLSVGGLLPEGEDGGALIARFQAAPPPLSPAPLNRIAGDSGGGLVLAP